MKLKPFRIINLPSEQDLDWENYQELLKEENKTLASNSIKPRKTKVNLNNGNCSKHNFTYLTSVYPSCPLCKSEKMTKDNAGLIRKIRGKK